MEPSSEGEGRGPCNKERAAWKQGAVAPARRDGDGGGASSSSSFARRCVGLVKEQRARLYIARRCVTMLACWRDRS